MLLTETRDELSTTWNLNKSYVKMPVSPDYIPVSLPPKPSLIQVLDAKRPVASGKDLLGYDISFLSSKCSAFLASWEHGQSYASISHT